MTDTRTEKPKRMTLSEIVELLLTRNGGERSSVTLARNAKGETQIEVVIRTTDDGTIPTASAAETVATEVYERLRARYPMSDGYVAARPKDA